MGDGGWFWEKMKADVIYFRFGRYLYAMGVTSFLSLYSYARDLQDIK